MHKVIQRVQIGALITMNKAPNTLLFKHEALTHAEHPADGGQDVLSRPAPRIRWHRERTRKGQACQAQPGRLPIWIRLLPTLPLNDGAVKLPVGRLAPGAREQAREGTGRNRLTGMGRDGDT